MRVMVIVSGCKGEENSESTQESMRKLQKFNEELTQAGVFLALERLRPSSEGVRVRFSGKSTTVIDGPFAETKELLGGFWLWNVKSMEEAVEWLKRAPFQDHEVEIRPLRDDELSSYLASNNPAVAEPVGKR